MSKWVKCNLSSISTISTGFPFKGQLYTDSGIRVVRGENVTIGSLRWDSIKCWNTDLDKYDKYYLKEDDVVIGMDGSRVGKNRARINANQLPLLLAQRVACVRSNEFSDQKFLYYLIFSDRFEEYVNRIQTGSSIPHISQKQIEDFPVYVPSDIDTQKCIGDFLFALDNKIEINNRINAELEAMAKTLYDYWFVQFDFPDANGKPYKTSGGKMVYNQVLKREIPEGWLSGRLGDLAELKYGKPLPSNQRSGVGFPVVGSGGIVGYHSDYFVKGPGIVVGRKGTIGELTYMYSNFSPIDTTYFVEPKIPIKFNYLLFLLNRLNLKNMNSDSAVPGLNRERALSSIIELVPEDLIQKYEKIVSPMFEKLANNEKENQQLTELRDWLLPMLMNGQVTVAEAEEKVAMAAEPEAVFGKLTEFGF